MSKYNYEGSEQFRPISAWGYVGYTILFCIPVIGWIIWIIFAFSSKNINRRSYARSFFCQFLLWLIIFIVLVVLAHFNVGNFRRDLKYWNIPYFNEAVDQMDQWLPSNNNASAKTEITKSTEKPTNQTTTVTTAPQKDNAADSSSNSFGNANGVRKEIKEAIDGYETFFKEYTDFMKKYSKSSNPLSMMSDYTKMMTEYANNMEKWEKFDKDNKMNDAELKYYTDATLRIEKMLLEAAQ